MPDFTLTSDSEDNRPSIISAPFFPKIKQTDSGFDIVFNQGYVFDYKGNNDVKPAILIGGMGSPFSLGETQEQEFGVEIRLSQDQSVISARFGPLDSLAQGNTGDYAVVSVCKIKNGLITEMKTRENIHWVASAKSRHPFQLIPSYSNDGEAGWAVGGTEYGSTITDRTNGSSLSFSGLDDRRTTTGDVFVKVTFSNGADTINNATIEVGTGNFVGEVEFNDDGQQETANLFIGRVILNDGIYEFYQACHTAQVLDYAFYQGQICRLFSSASTNADSIT